MTGNVIRVRAKTVDLTLLERAVFACGAAVIAFGLWYACITSTHLPDPAGDVGIGALIGAGGLVCTAAASIALRRRRPLGGDKNAWSRWERECEVHLGLYVAAVVLAIFGAGLGGVLHIYAANEPQAVLVVATLSDCKPDVGLTNTWCDASWTWAGVDHRMQRDYGGSQTPPPDKVWIDPASGDYLPEQGSSAKFNGYLTLVLCSVPLVATLVAMGRGIASARAGR